MKKIQFKVLSIFCLLCISVYGKNNFGDINTLYTTDMNIPSYLISIDKAESFNVKEKTNQKVEILSSLLNLDNETQPVLTDTLTDMSGGFHEMYTEYYKGIEVEGTRCIIHYNRQGIATNINGNFKNIVGLNTNPSISEEEALKTAINHIGAEVYAWDGMSTQVADKASLQYLIQETIPSGELMVYVKEGVAYLTYKFVIRALSPYLLVNIYIDANSAKVVDLYNAICTINTPVQTLYSYSQNIETSLLSGNYVLREASRGNGVETYKLFLYYPQYGQLSYFDYKSSDNSWSNLNDRDRAALDVHWGVEKTYDFYYTKFGRNSYDNYGSKLISYVDSTYDNASWNGSFMRYGMMGNLQNPLPLVSLDVIAHEFTHAVTGSTSQLYYSGESGAINEGLSDVFAACVEKNIKTNKGDSIWIIGEEVIEGGIRSMSNPVCKKYHGTGWVNTSNPNWLNDYGGVHTNSGVFNYWFYILVNGINGSNELGYPFSVYGIGIEKAIQICYLMNTSYLPSDASYLDAWLCSCLAAQQLNYSDFDIEQVHNAWVVVGVAPYISGNSVLCGVEEYNIENLPSNCNVTWSIDNFSFSIDSSGNQCEVEYSSQFVGYNVATLTATIKRNSQPVLAVSKRIVMHEPDISVQGYQPEAYVPDGYCPQNYFTITDDDLSLRSFNHQSTDSLLAEERSLPIVFVEEDEPRLIPELGVPNIYGGNNVTLTSTRFDGMDISFSGTTSPEYYNRSGNSIVFRMPTNINTYSVTVNGSGGEGCHDFSFRMNVIPPHGMTSNDPNIFLSLSGTTLSITFEGGIYFAGNGQIGYDPWNVAIYEVPSLGPPVYSAAVPGNQTTINVNTSSWSSGYYLIRVTQNGNVYTKKIFY